MNKDDIDTHLAALGQELADLGVTTPIRFLMIGGGYMLTQIQNREATGDVDGSVLNIRDPQHSMEYLFFKNAVHGVATRRKLPHSWLSDTIADFLTLAGPLPRITLWRKFDMLEVYVPPAGFILAHKLLAGRGKDEDDIKALCQILGISTRKQAKAVVDTYITNHPLQAMQHLDENLDRFF